MSVVDAATKRAYLETEYRVDGAPAFVLRIGVASPALIALYREAGCDCAAYLTACNPHSRQLTEAENAARQAALRGALHEAGWLVRSGAGVHPTGAWPGEASFLVLGIGEAAARRLGESFAQNAIVYCGADAVPRLVLLR